MDVVAKEMCRIIGPSKTPERITEYRPIILERFPNFPTMEIKIPRHSLFMKPWKEWAGGKSPTWWTAYNKVKHHRGKHYDMATLENALARLWASCAYSFTTTDCCLWKRWRLTRPRNSFLLRNMIRGPGHRWDGRTAYQMNEGAMVSCGTVS